MAFASTSPFVPELLSNACAERTRVRGEGERVMCAVAFCNIATTEVGRDALMYVLYTLLIERLESVDMVERDER